MLGSCFRCAGARPESDSQDRRRETGAKRHAIQFHADSFQVACLSACHRLVTCLHPSAGSLPPIRKNSQFRFWLQRIVRLDLHSEVMRALHALVHREFHRDLRALPRLNSHRTDDSFGRSAALFDFDDRLVQNLQGLVADVAELEAGLDRDVKRHLTKVNLLAVDREAGPAGHLVWLADPDEPRPWFASKNTPATSTSSAPPIRKYGRLFRLAGGGLTCPPLGSWLVFLGIHSSFEKVRVTTSRIRTCARRRSSPTTPHRCRAPRTPACRCPCPRGGACPGAARRWPPAWPPRQ